MKPDLFCTRTTRKVGHRCAVVAQSTSDDLSSLGHAAVSVLDFQRHAKNISSAAPSFNAASQSSLCVFWGGLLNRAAAGGGGGSGEEGEGCLSAALINPNKSIIIDV